MIRNKREGKEADKVKIIKERKTEWKNAGNEVREQPRKERGKKVAIEHQTDEPFQARIELGLVFRVLFKSEPK